MEKEIVELEEAVRAAQLAQDYGFLERVLADDFRFFTPQGRAITKREDIDQYKFGYLKMKTVEISDRTINIYGTAAVVRFNVKFEGQAGTYPFSSNFAFTRVYTQNTGSWKMVAGHSSDIK